jgi:hypothetical protein
VTDITFFSFLCVRPYKVANHCVGFQSLLRQEPFGQSFAAALTPAKYTATARDFCHPSIDSSPRGNSCRDSHFCSHVCRCINGGISSGLPTFCTQSQLYGILRPQPEIFPLWHWIQDSRCIIYPKFLLRCSSLTFLRVVRMAHHNVHTPTIHARLCPSRQQYFGEGRSA